MTQPLRLLALCSLLLVAFTATPARAQKGQFVIERTTHDFGAVAEGTQAQHEFTFRNGGQAPLRLTAVLPSCGCTTPEWPREAIAPGASGTIKVVYNSEGRPGEFRKRIVVRTDGEPAEAILYIQGDVVPPAVEGGLSQGNLLLHEERADVGEVAAGQHATHTLRLQNTGKRPVRIASASSSHANVAAEVPPKPLFTGDVAEIKVVVLTKDLKPGEAFDYTVTLRTDDVTQPVKAFHVIGRVAPAGTR